MADQIVFQAEETGSEAPAVETNATTENTSGDRPQWLPENFKTPEDFRKSFDEQRSELTRLQQAAKAGTEGENKEDGTEGEKKEGDDKSKEGDKKTEGDNTEAPDISKLTEDDFAKFSEELAEKGELTDESRAEIKKQINAPDWMIDTYIAGIKAQNDAATSSVVNAFGGEEAQAEIFRWAGEALSDKELETVNKQFQSKDMGTVLFAVDALKGKYEAANGKVPSRKVSGNANPSVSTGAYQSWDQVNKDMADPKYRTDPAFRAQVKEKLKGFNG